MAETIQEDIAKCADLAKRLRVQDTKIRDLPAVLATKEDIDLCLSALESACVHSANLPCGQLVDAIFDELKRDLDKVKRRLKAMV